MTNVFGLPLEQAEALLEREGIAVSCSETRSKKGVEQGSDARVIRQDVLNGKHVRLVYALFRTKPMHDG